MWWWGIVDVLANRTTPTNSNKGQIADALRLYLSSDSPVLDFASLFLGQRPALVASVVRLATALAEERHRYNVTRDKHLNPMQNMLSNPDAFGCHPLT